MRKIIEDQLKKVSFADLTNFDPNTNTYSIPKYTKPVYAAQKCYLVQLPTTIVNNPNSIIATNWNSGTYPKHEFLKIYVGKTMGKMIYVNGLAYDINTKQDLLMMWSGWLPSDEIILISNI